MTKGIVATLNNGGLASSGAHFTCQAIYVDKNGNGYTLNLNVAFGLTDELTNQAIGDAIRDDCNTRYSTNYGLTDVALVAALNFL
jgi:hypothetical protein